MQIHDNKIKAKVIADSINKDGKRITTLELDYNRYILSEFNTHRVFSRNTMSSRAIPVQNMIEQVINSPATPVEWGKNQAGMQADNLLDDDIKKIAENVWICASRDMARHAKYLSDIGVHKQIVNRLLEPFQMVRTIVTATDWDNFFYLRNHKAAQPEIQQLAKCIKNAMDNSTPVLKTDKEWHIPYINQTDNKYYTLDGKEISLGDALTISASCCAQVSYRKNDATLEKAYKVKARLINGNETHFSPFEHQARADSINHYKQLHGNFNGWAQYRKELEVMIWNKLV